MALYRISELSSLNFHHYWKQDFQIDAPYSQKFLPSDTITVQYTALYYDFFVGGYVRLYRGDTEIKITPVLIDSDYTFETYNLILTDLAIGSYKLVFTDRSGNMVHYSTFCIVEELDGTVLISAKNYRNELDTIFDEMNLFQFRVEATFLPAEYQFLADSETFRDQRNILTQLSSLPYETRTLTVGGGFGVPNWVARKVNYLFSLSEVYIDGDLYVRSAGSTPQITPFHPDYPLFVYKIDVEPGAPLDEQEENNQLYRIVDVNGAPVYGSNRGNMYVYGLY